MEEQVERLKMRKDILWGIYQEHRTHARHSETLRSTVSNMLIVASAALVSIVTYDKEINREDLGAALLLVGFGLLGLSFSVYYTSKIFKHKVRSEEYWKEFNTLLSQQSEDWNLEPVLNRANAKYAQGLLDRLWGEKSLVAGVEKVSNSLVLWSILPLLISSIGLYLTLMSIF